MAQLVERQTGTPRLVGSILMLHTLPRFTPWLGVQHRLRWLVGQLVKVRVTTPITQRITMVPNW